MLKALELSGFKSFADKTRFEFPPGITVVVGPNGSGKSNIVDAIKWVLGEQSAKSLRGKDMSDVIFKGSSGANARKPANSASATIVLENTDGRLMSDLKEINVTRRVYRSGESEYLINNEPCRLKDIRNLFRGTGVGTDAYSLIEQGKVERLLQAGAKERRAIFEEAAGISRFKAQKVEAERRLDRVQANLTRLADIVEEVGSRFRSIKNQASKAARYKEYTDRLQELRTFVGAKDFRNLSDKISENAQNTELLSKTIGQCKAAIGELDEKHRQAEMRVDAISSEANKLQDSITAIREQLSQFESTIEIARQRSIDQANRRQLLGEVIQKVDVRLQELKQIREKAESDRATFQSQKDKFAEQLQQLESKIKSTVSRVDSLLAQNEQSRSKSDALTLLIREIGQQVANHSVQIELHRQNHAKLTADLERLEGVFTSQNKLAAEFQSKCDECQRRAESSDSALATARQSVDTMTQKSNELQTRLADLRSQFSGITQRAKVIEELEKRQEGISSGAQELLKWARKKGDDQSGTIIGLVADLIQVNVQHAAIVDAALGDRAQYVVSRDQKIHHDLASGKIKVSGRVGILSLDGNFSLGSRADINLSSVDGIVGSVDTLVDLRGQYSTFIRNLLRATWIVNDLATAVRMRSEHSSEVRYVTLSGEVLESDGTLIVGPKSSVEGLVSRRSELRALVGQMESFKQEIAENEQSHSALKAELKTGQNQIQKLIGENHSLSKELANNLAQLEAAKRDLSSTTNQIAAIKKESTGVISDLNQAEKSRASFQADYSKQELALNSFVSLFASNTQEIEGLQTGRRELERQETTAKVELAKNEQQLADLQNRLNDYQRQWDELVANKNESHQELSALEKGIAEATQTMESASRSVTSLTEQREKQGSDFNRLHAERLELDRNRKALASDLQKQRELLRTTEDELGQIGFRVKQMEMERNQLAERLREDYGISVAEMEKADSPEQAENREQIDSEITELRQKIGSMGAVNMQALIELQELESRYQTLDKQYQDLVDARDSLLKIIQKINNDSRRLFVETLEAIRINFQKLFRQTFGGGQADILLEEGVDVLEAGVEIVATPPGKPKFSNSLLSGGEKALTAVSLLMSIFQFRPSPFCVLDEVDAPFDEANIGRFIDVLRSFLGWTKFVIVTHSKKTMTAATTLYGVTMQESGVSKRVSVRFEDVSDDGQISKEAVRRSEVEPSAGSQPAA